MSKILRFNESLGDELPLEDIQNIFIDMQFTRKEMGYIVEVARWESDFVWVRNVEEDTPKSLHAKPRYKSLVIEFDMSPRVHISNNGFDKEFSYWGGSNFVDEYQSIAESLDRLTEMGLEYIIGNKSKLNNPNPTGVAWLGNTTRVMSNRYQIFIYKKN